jgi:hypothetical protein
MYGIVGVRGRDTVGDKPRGISRLSDRRIKDKAIFSFRPKMLKE